jgi:cytidine deaminase
MGISDKDLITAATEARENAYSRYSGFEAGAIAAMVQEGGRRIARIAVVGGKGEVGSCTPCGGCRQRIAEFADEKTVILAIDDSGDWQEYRIASLLPASFHLP